MIYARPVTQTLERAKLHVSYTRKPFDFARTASFSIKYPEAWRTMLQALGREEALRLSQFKRNQIMEELRVKHRWTLQAIGEMFDLSRERVRQLTPPIEGPGSPPVLGDDGKPTDPRVMREELRHVFRRAARTPKAWDARGQLSKAWVVGQLGYEPDLPGLDFRNPGGSKTEFILRYGLGLESEEERHAWAEEMYLKRNMTYQEMACWLSHRFVPVTTMTVHRVITQYLGAQGYGTGPRANP